MPNFWIVIFHFIDSNPFIFTSHVYKKLTSDQIFHLGKRLFPTWTLHLHFCAFDICENSHPKWVILGKGAGSPLKRLDVQGSFRLCAQPMSRYIVTSSPIGWAHCYVVSHWLGACIEWSLDVPGSRNKILVQCILKIMHQVHLVMADFSHIGQGYFTGNGAIMIWLLHCQWSNPDEYG